MPITRATSRASRGAAQAPSTIYTNYNEIVSMIQGGLPPRRAQRAPKRAREEPDYVDHREFQEWQENSTEIEEISAIEISPPSSPAIVWPEDLANAWCGLHGESCTDSDCEFRKIFGTNLGEEMEENMNMVDSILETFGRDHKCVRCDSKIRTCTGLCYEDEMPAELHDRISPLKQESLIRIRLLQTMGMY